MTQQAIPEDIRRFVLTSIPSVPHLEALLLLRGAGDAWDHAVLAERLYIGEKAAAALMEELCRAGMCAVETSGAGVPRYRYHPSSDFLRTTIDSLAEFYARHLVEITHLIHSRLDRKAQQFADAFKWRKDS